MLGMPRSRHMVILILYNSNIEANIPCSLGTWWPSSGVGGLQRTSCPLTLSMDKYGVKSSKQMTSLFGQPQNHTLWDLNPARGANFIRLIAIIRNTFTNSKRRLSASFMKVIWRNLFEATTISHQTAPGLGGEILMGTQIQEEQGDKHMKWRQTRASYPKHYINWVLRGWETIFVNRRYARQLLTVKGSPTALI